MNNQKQDLINFWKKFSTMLSSGVPILETLKVLKEEAQNERMKIIIQTITDDLMTGSSLYDSIVKFPSEFPLPIQTMIKSAEAMGTLINICGEIAKAYENNTFTFESDTLHGKVESTNGKNAISLVNAIIFEAIENKAADIHFEWVAGKLRARLRVDGCLHESTMKIPPEMQNQIITRIKIMAGMNEKENRVPQDGRVQIKVKDKDYDLRVSVVPYATGESAVLRILSRQACLLKLDQVGLTPDNLDRLRWWLKRSNGIIIASGPMSSGKTTLLYCMLAELNTPEIKITTIEDPIEYIIEGINQQMVRSDAGVTFARAIRAQLRQAPNIMLIGETRDLETAQLEVQVALTGHLVLTSLHTPGAPEILRRMLDIGIEPFLLNNTFIGGVAQRLVRMICTHCREEYKPESWVMDFLGPHKPKQFFHGKGCEKCHNFGYRGRTAIHEMLELDDDLRKLVAKDAGAAELRSQALKSGMISMKDDGLAKAAQGITTVEEVLRVCTTV